MRKEGGVRTGNIDEERDINQNKARETERIVSLSSGLNLEMRRLSLIHNSEVVLQLDFFRYCIMTVLQYHFGIVN